MAVCGPAPEPNRPRAKPGLATRCKGGTRRGGAIPAPGPPPCGGRSTESSRKSGSGHGTREETPRRSRLRDQGPWTTDRDPSPPSPPAPRKFPSSEGCPTCPELRRGKSGGGEAGQDNGERWHAGQLNPPRRYAPPLPRGELRNPRGCERLASGRPRPWRTQLHPRVLRGGRRVPRRRCTG